MNTPWHFFAIVAKTSNGFTWQWQKNENPTLTSRHFDFYFDCVADARANGYDGPLPAGPRAPLHRPPDTIANTKVLPMTALSSHTRRAPVVMAARPGSNTGSKRKAAASRMR